MEDVISNKEETDRPNEEPKEDMDMSNTDQVNKEETEKSNENIERSNTDQVNKEETEKSNENIERSNEEKGEPKKDVTKEEVEKPKEDIEKSKKDTVKEEAEKPKEDIEKSKKDTVKEEAEKPKEDIEKSKKDTVKEEAEKPKEEIGKSNIKNLNKFDRLVKKNKESGKYWYYGLKGKWWWGMSEKQARQKIEKGQSLGYNQKVAIASIVRNEEHNGNLKRFLSCCDELEEYHDLVYIFIEGDSSDKTYGTLRDWLVNKDNYILKKVDRKHQPFAKNRDKKRTVYFAELRNMLIDSILSIPEISEVLMIDANYGWKGDLISELRHTKSDIAAPLAISRKDNDGKYFFYDTWAFRKDGHEFAHKYPYIKGFDPKKPISVDSAGGGYLIKRKVLEAKVRYNGDKDTEHFSFCQKAKKKGFTVKINPKAHIKKGGYKQKKNKDKKDDKKDE